MPYPRPPTDEEWSRLHTSFPNLVRANVMLEGPATNTYNCIAWALGYTDRWINPPASRDDFIALFLSPVHPRGYDVVLPARDGNALCDGYRAAHMTHASRKDGATWSSKLGRTERISHNRLGVEGVLYGQVDVSFA